MGDDSKTDGRDTGLLLFNNIAEVMRGEVKLAVPVPLRATGAAFGQAGLTRLDSFAQNNCCVHDVCPRGTCMFGFVSECWSM